MKADPGRDGVHVFRKNLAVPASFKGPSKQTGIEDAIIVLVMEHENRVVAIGDISKSVRDGEVLNAVDLPFAHGCPGEIAGRIAGPLVAKLNLAWIWKMRCLVRIGPEHQDHAALVVSKSTDLDCQIRIIRARLDRRTHD